MKYLLSCLACSALLLGCNRSNVEQASREFNQLPPVVQRTVRSTVPDAEIADVGKHNRDGRVVYRIEFRDSRRYPAMEVAEDGRVVKYEAGTAMGGAESPATTQQGGGANNSSMSALPPGVQRAIAEMAPRAEVTDIRRIDENGRLVYEIEYAGPKPRRTLQVLADGTVLKRPVDTSSRQDRR